MAEKNKLKINENTLFQKVNKNILTTEVDNETVLMNTENGLYFGLNETTSDIWNFLEKENTLNNITSHLMTQYEVSKETCTKETAQVLIGLMRIGLVIIKK